MQPYIFQNIKIFNASLYFTMPFVQIKDCLHASQRKFSDGKYKLRDLFKLVHFLRRQSSLMNEIFGTTQLLILFFLFTLSIIVWMMIFQFNEGDISMSLVLVVASIGFVQLTRFATVATFSEKIVEQVSNQVRAKFGYKN